MKGTKLFSKEICVLKHVLHYTKGQEDTKPLGSTEFIQVVIIIIIRVKHILYDRIYNINPQPAWLIEIIQLNGRTNEYLKKQKT